MLSPFCAQHPQYTYLPENILPRHSQKSPPTTGASSPPGFLSFPNNDSGRRKVVRARAARTEGDTAADENKAIGAAPNSFLTFLCPLLKLFAGGDPSKERNDFLEITTSSISSLARLPWGSRSLPSISQSVDPTSPLNLQLYEFEACPFCRRVREAMTELDLSVQVYPCPKGSVRHREMIRNLGGKEQFPFLVDLNTGISLYESGDIVKYLFQQYGHGRNPSFGLLQSTVLTGWVPTLLRAGRGMTAWSRARTEPPLKMLELFSYENNLYARIVREALCELELPYILYNVGEGSSKHELLFNMSGSKEVPYLVDPNTGFKTGDYKRILRYLFQTYATES